MAYNSTGFIVHDADAHIMETPTWLRDYADPGVRDRLVDLAYEGGNELQQAADLLVEQGDLTTRFERLADRHRSDEYRSVEAEEIMLRKNFAATGSFLAEDRPRALDLLGFASQLVFNTFHNSRLREWEHSGDAELAVGAARAHNRGMAEFCAVDRRLLSTLYVPLGDIEGAEAGSAGIVHSDLHNKHLLVDKDGSLTGVLDFGDAFIGSIAWDFALLNWYYGTPNAAVVARHHPAGLEALDRGVTLSVVVGLYKLAKNPEDHDVIPRLRRCLEST